MSLKAWLPLNKDLKVINFENISVTNYDVTLDNNGVFGKSYYFNGSSYLQFNKLNISKSQQLSLSFWCYSTNGNLGSIFICRNSGTHQISLYSTNLNFRDSKHSSLTTFTFEQPSANVWTHYVIIYDKGNWIIYKNGIKVKEQVYSSAILNSIDEIRIGRYQSSSGNEYFTGKLNDFRVYDNALTEEDVKRIYQQKLFELVPYSGAKDVLFDRSGFMNMPLVNNGANFQNNALYFNGSAKLRPKNGNVGFTMDDGTLSVWFTIETASTNYQIIYIDSVSKFAIGIIKSSNTLIATCNGTGSKTKFTGTSIKYDGSINNIIVSYNTGKTPQFMLINGVSVGTNGTDVWTESSGLTIGNRMYNSAQSGFKGKLLKVGVYNRQFTQDEAVELYNSEKGMFLPDDYIQLEYIQSNGTQWIDVGVKANQNTKAEIKFEITGNATGSNAVFGSRTSYTSNAFNVWSKCGNGNIGANYCKAGAINSTIAQAANVTYYITLEKNKLSVNGNVTTFTQNTNFTTPGNIYLFNIYGGDATSTGTSNRILIGKVYSFKLYDSDIIIRNMIPSRRKSDNVIGMYDMVSRQFFTNSGTGSFTGA